MPQRVCLLTRDEDTQSDYRPQEPRREARSRPGRKTWQARRGVVALATGAAIVVGGSARLETQTLSLGLASQASAGDRDDAQAIEAFVEGLSAGQLAVEIRGDTRTCGLPEQCLRALRVGDLDVVPVSTGDIVRLFPELQVLELPYLFENELVVARVFDGAFQTRVREAVVDRTGLRLMAIGPRSGWRTFATSNRPIRSPEDVDGLTFWTARSPLEAGLVEAFGGNSTALPRAQLPRALSTGVVHGVTVPLTELVTEPLYAELRYVTLDRHSQALTLWLMNDVVYRTLPVPAQQIVQAAFDEVARRRRGAAQAAQVAAVHRFESTGGTVYAPTPAERMRFLLSAGRVAVQHMETYGADWLVWLEAAIAHAEEAIELR